MTAHATPHPQQIESPAPALDFSSVLAWYTGKARDAMRDQVLPVLATAAREEVWPPKAARSVRAALARQAVAAKFARANERRDHADGDEGLLDDVMEVRGAAWYRAKIRGWEIVHAMMFGQFQSAPDVLALVAAFAPHARGDAERAALETARRWAADFAPVAALVARLDATRARPSYVFGEISRSVLDNVGRGMGIAFASVRMPEIRWHRIEKVDERGRLTISWDPEILWPDGTRHGLSRFVGSRQCQACGHKIGNPHNWIPLVADGVELGAAPMSIWVGRDCARHLFGCTATGDAEFRRDRAKTA